MCRVCLYAWVVLDWYMHVHYTCMYCIMSWIDSVHLEQWPTWLSAKAYKKSNNYVSLTTNPRPTEYLSWLVYTCRSLRVHAKSVMIDSLTGLVRKCIFLMWDRTTLVSSQCIVQHTCILVDFPELQGIYTCTTSRVQTPCIVEVCADPPLPHSERDSCCMQFPTPEVWPGQKVATF